MSDLRLAWNSDLWAADLVTDASGDLLLDGGLETAVTLSLFTDARADADDELPAGAGTDRRGWWGDAVPLIDGYRLGSKLWLLSREKTTVQILQRARRYAEEALAWMVTSGLASGVEVVTERTAENWLALAVTITRPDGPVSYRYDRVWQLQAEKGTI
ncbi:MAG: phage GP46 family protein [Rhodospirillum sp.]|nr:phage GP46 family protein [Rhodospirillum sp.]MCF8500173.1 phage GP46 family protein [Rhodospirillum sp.]